MEVFRIKRPNSICKNINCRKPFYACAFCTHTNAWRSMACSIECYLAYGDQVCEARAAKKKVNLLPERTDMTETEIKEFMEKPIDEIIAITNEELKDYSGSIAEIVTQINDEIDAANENTKDENNIDVNEEAAAVSLAAPRKGRKKKTEGSEVNS